MRVRAVLVASVLLAVAIGVPADAAPTPALVLSGAGIQSVDVTLTKKTIFSTAASNSNALTASYRGSFAGFAVLGGPDRQRLVGGSVFVRGRQLRYGNEAPSVASFAEFPASSTWLHLKPGRYRFVLVADGPATVRIPATQGLTRELRLSPRRREPSISARRYDLAGVPGVSATSVPFTLRERTLVVASFHSSPGDYAPAYIALCTRRPATPRTPCEDGWFHDPGRQRTAGVDAHERASKRGPGDFRFDFWEAIAGPNVRPGDGFVAVFDKGA